MTMKKENVKVVKKKSTRRVDVKSAAKDTLSKKFERFLTEEGIKFNSDHTDYEFTKGTLVVHMEDTDVQVKLITPKAGLERYKKIVYVSEEEYDEFVEAEEEEEAENLIEEAELEELMQEMEMEDALVAQ